MSPRLQHPECFVKHAAFIRRENDWSDTNSPEVVIRRFALQTEAAAKNELDAPWMDTGADRLCCRAFRR